MEATTINLAIDLNEIADLMVFTTRIENEHDRDQQFKAMRAILGDDAWFKAAEISKSKMKEIAQRNPNGRVAKAYKELIEFEAEKARH